MERPKTPSQAAGPVPTRYSDESFGLRNDAVPPSHRDLGHGLEFRLVGAITSPDRHPTLDGLYEAGERDDID